MGGSVLNDHYWFNLSRPGTKAVIVTEIHQLQVYLGEELIQTFDYQLTRRFNKAVVQPALSQGGWVEIMVAPIWQIKDCRR
jgi:hypothetical protein